MRITEFFSLDRLTAWSDAAIERASDPSLWVQAGIVAAAALIGYAATRRPANRLRERAKARDPKSVPGRAYRSLASVIWALVAVVILWTATAALSAIGAGNELTRVAASLLNAWTVVRLVTMNVSRGPVSRILPVVAWTIAALYILGLLAPITEALEAAAITVGAVRISALRVVTSVIIAVIALWTGRTLGEAAQFQISSNRRLTPSMAGLLGQIAKIALIVLALLIAMQAIGINLTTLTVFSGALAFGIGFGLQAVFSNFVSGIIILVEKSVKVGDFIELQSGVTGLVREINIRSTLVTTNDNVDILVPNEEFLKAEVINWTLREAGRRLRVPFGVAYGTKKELARDAGLAAAKQVRWTFDDGAARAPQVWLVEFGDSSLNFELVVWLIDEAVKRPAKVIADYNWAILGALEDYGIEIPFPQRDLHLRSPDAIPVRIDKGDANAASAAD